MALTFREADPAPDGATPGLPALGPAGWLRWTWRQLTSMRVALLLLLLLALAALPGSLVPQRPQDPAGVAAFLADRPTLGAWLDRLGLFDVYASAWFSAVYLVLFVSLVGCILPRTAAHLRALRSDPPRVPRSFDRFEVRSQRVAAGAPAQVSDAALAALGRRYRTRTGVEGEGGRQTLTISAERGYLRETGNLAFHLALVGVLVAVGLGQLFGYRGQVLVVEERGFANAVVSYDSFDAGAWFRDEALEPFQLTLESVSAQFDPVTLAPRDFAAEVTVREGSGERAEVIRVNRPLRLGGAAVYLAGNGYAPLVTVRDGAGEIAFSGPVPFLPQDAAYTSRGVVKVPDVSAGQPQLGLVGFLLPTALFTEEGAGSVFPQPLDPVLVLTAYAGDLGLDDGVPQNVYELDTSRMGLVTTAGVLEPGSGAEVDGDELTILLRPGEQAELPGGLGGVEFDALPRFAALDLRHDPTLGAVLAFALLAIAGLVGSLFVPRRRIWLRLAPAPDGRTVVAAAALSRGADPGLRPDLDRVIGRLPPGGAEDA